MDTWLLRQPPQRRPPTVAAAATTAAAAGLPRRPARSSNGLLHRSDKGGTKRRRSSSGSSFVQCPLCGRSFHHTAIAEHASDCTGERPPPAAPKRQALGGSQHLPHPATLSPVTLVRQERLAAARGGAELMADGNSPVRLTPPIAASLLAQRHQPPRADRSDSGSSGSGTDRATTAVGPVDAAVGANATGTSLWSLASRADTAAADFRTSLLPSPSSIARGACGHADVVPRLQIHGHPTLAGQTTVLDFLRRVASCLLACHHAWYAKNHTLA
jgi:hypothetical protein